MQFLLLTGSIVESLLVNDGTDASMAVTVFLQNNVVVSTSPKHPLNQD